ALFSATSVDDFGRYLDVQLGNGVREQYAYEPDGRRLPTHQLISGPAIYDLEQIAARDAAGRVTRVGEYRGLPSVQLRETTYTYDALYRVVRAHTAGGNLTAWGTLRDEH